MKVIILVFVALVSAYADDVNILCTIEYCEQYLKDNTCVDIPTKCSIQNTTHNGIFLPFAGPCHCCDYCVANLDEGDACAIGDAASPTPAIICGDLLYCTTDGASTCQTIVTSCTNEQRKYDNNRESGTLGHLELRPNCNRRGLYDPYKCIPGEICYCVSEEGDRIFGEIPFTILASSIMHCECSRKYEKASAFMGRNLLSGEFLRCSSNGDYDALQCLDDNCFCVHPRDGSLAINTREPSVNITSISNETISCFDFDVHYEGEYYKECEAQVIDILEEIAEYEEFGYEVFGYSFPSCQLDGHYAPVQRNNTSVYCADPTGDVLENFIIDVDDPLVNDMDCRCARTRFLEVDDKPDCCRNGNYNPVQCRRGLCRCVDENGNQDTSVSPHEVNFNEMVRLPCFQTGCARTADVTMDAPNEELRFNALTDHSI